MIRCLLSSVRDTLPETGFVGQLDGQAVAEYEVKQQFLPDLNLAEGERLGQGLIVHHVLQK